MKKYISITRYQVKLLMINYIYGECNNGLNIKNKIAALI